MFGDVIKTFGRNFVIAALVPSLVFVSANLAFILAGLCPTPDLKGLARFGLTEWMVPLTVTALLALGLSQCNIQIIRLYEGYYRATMGYAGLTFVAVGGLGLVGSRFVSLHQFIAEEHLVALVTVGTVLLLIGLLQWLLEAFYRFQHAKTSAKIARLGEEEHERFVTEAEFVKHYPRSKAAVLPTKLGNIIRAFEYYPHTHYNIDPITGWPRITAVIPPPYLETIQQAEANVCFALNLSFIIAILGLEAVFLLAPRPGGIIVSCAVLAYIFYRVACSAAREQWGERIRSVFDLYRLDVLKQMGVFLPARPMTLTEEQEVWAVIQLLTFYERDPGAKLAFLPKTWDLTQLELAKEAGLQRKSELLEAVEQEKGHLARATLALQEGPCDKTP